MDCAQCLFDIDERLHANYDLDLYPVKTDHLLHGEKPLVMIYKSLDDEHKAIPLLAQSIIEKYDAKNKVGILNPKFDENKEWENLPFIKSNNIYFGHFNLPKGLEFDTVIIPHLDQIFEGNNIGDASFELSNFRKLFVAVTRAKHKLIITSSRSFPTQLTPLLSLLFSNK